MKILINGDISNAYQLIGVIAAKMKIAEKYNASVFLNLRYNKYWGKLNVSPNIINIIQKINIDEKRDVFDKEFFLAINHPSIRKRNQLIVDDGLGAYRLNPFSLIRVISNEKKMINNESFDLISKIQFLAIFFIKTSISFFCGNHISIFKKNIFSYFDINCENKMYFLRAISYIYDFLKDDCSVLSKKSVVFLTQPYQALGFENQDEYKLILKRVVEYIKADSPEISFLIKKHPIDDCDYRDVDALVLEDNLPAEIFFHKNKNMINKIIGFSSTSLLSGKILFDIPGFYIKNKKKLKVADDFWVNKGFVKYLELLNIDSAERRFT